MKERRVEVSDKRRAWGPGGCVGWKGGRKKGAQGQDMIIVVREYNISL